MEYAQPSSAMITAGLVVLAVIFIPLIVWAVKSGSGKEYSFAFLGGSLILVWGLGVSMFAGGGGAADTNQQLLAESLETSYGVTAVNPEVLLVTDPPEEVTGVVVTNPELDEAGFSATCTLTLNERPADAALSCDRPVPRLP